MEDHEFFYAVRVENLPEPDKFKDYFMSFIRRDTNFQTSYKPVLLQAMITLADDEGQVRITDLVKAFRDFYLDRQRQGKTIEVPTAFMVEVDRKTDREITQRIFEMPFEKYESRGLLGRTRDLDYVAFPPAVWNNLSPDEKAEIRGIATKRIVEYYNKHVPGSY